MEFDTRNTFKNTLHATASGWAFFKVWKVNRNASFLDGIDLRVKLQKAKFEQLCQDLFRYCLEPIEKVLRDSQISKSQIDEIEISDLGKKRILSSVENQMQKKGYALSNTPDLIINIDTKSREDVYINRYNEYPYYGWYPFGMSMSTSYRPSSRIVGLLYIDVIDAKTGSLLWQGNGSGTLIGN